MWLLLFCGIVRAVVSDDLGTRWKAVANDGGGSVVLMKQKYRMMSSLNDVEVGVEMALFGAVNEKRSSISCDSLVLFKVYGTLRIVETDLIACGIWTKGGSLNLVESRVFGYVSKHISAVQCEDSGTVNMSDVEMRNNAVLAQPMTGVAAKGGAVYLGSGCTANLLNISMIGNRVGPDPSCGVFDGCMGGLGGAIYAFRARSVTCLGCTMRQNIANAGESAATDGGQGGAWYVAYTPYTVCEVCDFSQNTATGSITPGSSAVPSAGGPGDGGAVKLSYSGTAMFIETVFEFNQVSASDSEPARGGALSMVFVYNATCVRCSFNGNKAGQSETSKTNRMGGIGGAISVLASSAGFYASDFFANQAYSYTAIPEVEADIGESLMRIVFRMWQQLDTVHGGKGGAAYITAGEGAVAFLECSFTHNLAAKLGHDIFATKGLMNATTCVDVKNCTMDTPKDCGALSLAHQGPVVGALSTLCVASLVAVDTKLDVEASRGASSNSLEVVVVGSYHYIDEKMDDEEHGYFHVPSGSTKHSIESRSCDEESQALGTRSAALRLKSTKGPLANAQNTSLSVLALWADIVLGDKNQTDGIAVSSVVLLGGAMAAANGGTMAIQDSLFLADAAVVGKFIDDFKVELHPHLPSLILQGSGVLGHPLHRKGGSVALCGVDLEVNTGSELVLDATQITLGDGASLKVGTDSFMLVRRGTSRLHVEEARTDASLVLRGALYREPGSSIEMYNATFYHDGFIHFEAMPQGTREPVVSAMTVVLGPEARVNASISTDEMVTLDQFFNVITASSFTASLDDNSSTIVTVPAVDGASNGVGLRLDFASTQNGVDLLAVVDYVDCDQRYVGRYRAPEDAPAADASPQGYSGPRRPSRRNGSKFFHDDDAMEETPLTSREQCILCMEDNSTCAFSYNAARKEVGDEACAMPWSESTDFSDYRSSDCCEDGCGIGGRCSKGRCVCSWWWTNSRCTSLSWKARSVIALGLLVVLGIIAAATYVSLWQRRKKAAIGEALDELRDHLLSEERSSTSSQADGLLDRYAVAAGCTDRQGEESNDRYQQMRSSSVGVGAPLERKPSLLRWISGTTQSARSRSVMASGSSQQIDASFLRDVRERLVLRDVLIKRSELTLNEKIGSGSFGDVYRGRFRGCEVAVKKLRVRRALLTKSAAAEEIERFRAEAVLLSRLRHPNVTMIMGVVVERRSNSTDSYQESEDTKPATGVQRFFWSPRRNQPQRRSESAESSSSHRVSSPPLVTLSIVTEFMSAGSLSELLYDVADFSPIPRPKQQNRKLISSKDWTLDLLLASALQAAQGMTYLHSRNVCHRDLKASNLLVDDHWRLKIGDYNLSRFVDSTDNSSSLHARQDSEASAFHDDEDETFNNVSMTADVGSVRWMAPEIFGGGRKRTTYSLAADVYSFAMCIYELEARAPPFYELSSRFDISDAVSIDCKVPTLTEKATPALTDLYLSCAQHDPALRPSFSDISDHLDAQLRTARRTSHAHSGNGGTQQPDEDTRSSSSVLDDVLSSTSGFSRNA